MIQLRKQIAMAVAAAVLAGASAASQAHDGSMEMRKDSAACQSAKLSAFFDLQRQRTEGGPAPTAELPTPAECKDMTVADEKAQSTSERVAKREARRDER